MPRAADVLRTVRGRAVARPAPDRLPVRVPVRTRARAGVPAPVLVVVLAMLGLAGCTATDDASEAGRSGAGPSGSAAPSAGTASSEAAATMPPAALDGIAVEVRQGRADWGDRVVQLRVVNGTAAPFVVESGTLRASSVTGAASSDPARARVVPAGGSRDFSVPLGRPVCPAATPDAAAPDTAAPDAAAPDAVVDLVLADEAGRHGTLRTVPADPQGHLARIHGEDCAAAAVAAGASLTIGPDVLVRDRSGLLTATLRLTVRPVPGGPRVSVTAVERSNLLTPTSGLRWTDPALVDLPPDGTTVDLELTQARCDPHAVAEDKRGTFFGVRATVDDVPQRVFYLGVDDGVRAQVYAYVGRACGWDVEVP